MAKPRDLAAGEWWQVPRVGNSRLADVYASPNPGGNQAAIIDSWGGGTFDSKRGDLDILGGGHLDYQGNEWNAFNVRSLLFRLKNYYSTAGAGDTEAAAGGGPSSRHGYTTYAYSRTRDKIMCGPGSFLYGSGGVFGPGMWEGDASFESPSSWTSAFTQRDNQPTFPTGSSPGASNFLWSETLQKGFIRQNGIASWDPTAGVGSQWTINSSFEAGPLNAQGPACIVDGTTPLHVMVGNGNTNVQQLATPFGFLGAENNFGATGATAIESVVAPGQLYDPRSDRIVAWAGLIPGGTDRRDTYHLNRTTKVWTRVPGTGDIPTAPNSNGTYLFKYIGDLPGYEGLCVLVNSTTQDVYFYRSSEAPVTYSVGARLFANARRA